MKQSYSAYKAGDMTWAQFSILRSSNFCIACHTRADRGIQDYPIAWKPELSAFTTSQRIEFYLANRQYSQAKREARDILSSKTKASRDPLNWMKSLSRVMTMVVRVKADFKEAESLTQLALQNDAIPFYMKADIRQWANDIRTWKTQSPARSTKDKLARAKQMLRQSQDLDARNSNAVFILNLRASNLLHEVFGPPKASQYDEALYLSGISSEGLGESGLAQSIRNLHYGFSTQPAG